MAIKKKDLHRLGWREEDPGYGLAYRVSANAKGAGMGREEILSRLVAVRSTPAAFVDDEIFGSLAEELEASGVVHHGESSLTPQLLDEPVAYHIWGEDQIDAGALEQMNRACRLPISVAGAQMPDGHVGYGLPIGGVLATRNAVIPYGVGVDIGCRMKLSILDVPADRFDGLRGMLRNALRAETSFGVGATFDKSQRREHDVMDHDAWRELPRAVTDLKDRAHAQLGSSGSGNHFVEWGSLTLQRDELGIPPGSYIALLSHSGSRGLGAQIAARYTEIAMQACRLPKEALHLAWLDLRSSAGQEYWTAMELAGAYSAANHDCIHRHVLRAAGFKPLVQVENHHNFAWKEQHLGEELIVHRKGATPAGAGVLGVIPGSMADPGFVVRGKGNARALDSAAHGAGRRMSRAAATKSILRSQMRDYLAERGVELLAAGIDEAPMAYKSIHEVMAAQADLVEVLATFQPRMVLMADGGKAED